MEPWLEQKNRSIIRTEHAICGDTLVAAPTIVRRNYSGPGPDQVVRQLPALERAVPSPVAVRREFDSGRGICMLELPLCVSIRNCLVWGAGHECRKPDQRAAGPGRVRTSVRERMMHPDARAIPYSQIKRSAGGFRFCLCRPSPRRWSPSSTYRGPLQHFLATVVA